jgi:hypothetical protein
MDYERGFLSRFMHNIPVAREVVKEKGLPYLINFEVRTETDTFFLHMNHVYSKLYSKILNRPLVHVIGNSHTMAFKKNRSFIVHNIGPATAYNLINKNSSVRSNEKLFRIINKIVWRRDLVILVFGEIDCRVHFYNQHKKSGGKTSIDTLMDMTLANYGEVLRQLKDMGINFIVYGVLPATREIYRFPPYATKRMREEEFNNFKNSYNYLASAEERVRISQDFNDKLKKFCEDAGYRYIDIYSLVVNDEGFIKDEFVADEIHVNGKIMPFVKEKLINDFHVKI